MFYTHQQTGGMRYTRRGFHILPSFRALALYGTQRTFLALPMIITAVLLVGLISYIILAVGPTFGYAKLVKDNPNSNKVREWLIASVTITAVILINLIAQNVPLVYITTIIYIPTIIYILNNNLKRLKK